MFVLGSWRIGLQKIFQVWLRIYFCQEERLRGMRSFISKGMDRLVSPQFLKNQLKIVEKDTTYKMQLEYSLEIYFYSVPYSEQFLKLSIVPSIDNIYILI